MNRSDMEKRLQSLNTTADQALSGLEADRRLLLRIEKAAKEQTAPRPVRRMSWAPVLACAMMLMLCLPVGLRAMRKPQEQLITAQSAGSTPVTNELALNLPGDSLSIGRSGGTPDYRSIWADGSGTYPLVGVNGRYYRMLTTPSSLSSAVLGESLGTVSEFTTEPSLSDSDVILSNAASFGTEIFAVRGMKNTLVAAEVNGSMRLFQRVSFNGNALRGSESFEDTMQISGRIRAMEMSGVGTITDASLCNELFSLIVDCASYESSGSVSGKRSLLIELDNGLVVQMSVKDDNLSACGTWNCPEFIEAFEAAVQ
ncbi:MAG: hypothetical protein IJ507_06325 [Clostridia bacterium]|nr:hypothetical protein [Clostridia bacterium]